MNILEKIDKYLEESVSDLSNEKLKKLFNQMKDEQLSASAAQQFRMIRSEMKKRKLKESYGGLDSHYLQNSIGLVISDIKRDPDEKHMVKVLKFVKDRLNQSYPDGDVTQDNVADLLREPGARNIMKKAGTSYYEIIDYIWQD